MTAMSSLAVTKVSKASVAGVQYFVVLFDVGTNAATAGGGGTTSSGCRYGVGIVGATSWGRGALNRRRIWGGHHYWNLS